MQKTVFIAVLKVILASLFTLTLTGCDRKVMEEPDPALKKGAELFAENCSKCHPRTGRGDYLKRIPATLLTKKSAEELRIWIRGAYQHREMPSFEDLSEAELNALVAYLHNEITR